MKRSKITLPRLDTRLTDEVIQSYYQALNCPRALACWMMYKYNEHSQLAAMVCNPNDHNDPWSFRLAYLATHFLRKADFLKIPKKDRERVTLEGFEASEAQCRATNQRWRTRRFETADWNMIHRVSRKIFSILGERPSIDRWLDLSSWGPGATLSVKRREASSYKKFRDERGITHSLHYLIPLIDEAFPPFKGRLYSVETGDRVVVVPKNATVDRVILIQPGWNLFFQKGVGGLIRSKLRFCGLDLNDEASPENQRLSKVASITGDLATVDLKNASDTMAIEPLREVLPPEWFRLLDLLRSERSQDGRRWEKFSSMGNGFTFELETLLFYAIACCTCDKLALEDYTVSVFGDDVILPAAAYPSFRENLALFGFSTNQSKTFSTGRFRESCGAHWFDGVDCKPVFLKERISSVTKAYKAYNAIRHLGHRCNSYYGCDRRFRRCCRLIESHIPKAFRIRVPFGYGDVGLVSNFDEATPRRAGFGWQGYIFTALSVRPFTFDTEESAILLVRLTEHADQEQRNTVAIKTRTRPYFNRRAFTPAWYNLGPWL